MRTNIASVPKYDREHGLATAASALVPMLRAAQSDIDAAARTPDHVAAPLKAAAIYSIAVAQEQGGIEASLSTWRQVITEVGRGDAGVAWGVALITSSNWMVSNFFPRSVSDEVFSKPGTCVAGVLSPRGVQARRVDGGIIVDKGIWFFNSGIYQADWDLLGVPLLNDAGEMVGAGVAIVPISDVHLLHDWDAAGLRGSGSTNVTMENVFIPAERIIDMVACMEGRQPRMFPDSPIYRSAVMPLMSAIMTFPVLGAGQHMLEEFLEKLPKRDIKGTPYMKSGEAPVTHIQLGQASSKIDLAKGIVERACDEIEDLAERGAKMPALDRSRICRDCAVAVQLVWEAVEILADASGGSFGQRGNVLNRIWQDVKVPSMHPFLTPMTHYENHGRALAGVEPPLTIS